MIEIIEKKQEGYELSKREINEMIEKYTCGMIPDYQMSAFLMAVYFQGMSDKESAYLTMAMARSGEQIDLSSIKGVKVDKHSTGGVGDKVSLILAPLVSACGVNVAKMSGRGLGHTGGTIDKLESFPNFHVEIPKERFIQLVNQNHLSIMGQSDAITPADKKLYALRDVTATVNSIPLIASSIMSKKIASGADAIVLDVKCGNGAFMKTIEEAEALAKTMVNIGTQVGRKTIAIISNMNQPLGYAVGNTLEVKEAIETLKGNGPEDVTELCYELGSYMLLLSEKAKTIYEAKKLLKHAVTSSQALETFKTMIKAQGGDASYIDQPSKWKEAAVKYSIVARDNGYIKNILAHQIGVATMKLGAGRMTKDDTICHEVGIVLHKKVGDQVEKGETIATLHAQNHFFTESKQLVEQAFSYTNEPVSKSPIILRRIEE